MCRLTRSTSDLIADFALPERSRPATVAARRSFLREREVTVPSGPAAPDGGFPRDPAPAKKTAQEWLPE
jgi:hypothetical protein